MEHRESVASVERGKKAALVVGALEDIDFTVVWPGAISQCPKGRPGTAALRGSSSWRMLDVCDEKTLCPLLGGLDSDTWTANTVNAPVGGIAIISVARVDLHLSGSVIERDEAVSLGPASVDVSEGVLIQFSQGKGKRATDVTKPWVGSASWRWLAGFLQGMIEKPPYGKEVEAIEEGGTGVVGVQGIVGIGTGNQCMWNGRRN